MPKTQEASPVKSFAEELDILRKSFRDCLRVYAARVEADLGRIREATLAQSTDPNLSSSKLRDLRDMISLCRTLDIKPDKGRRKDLKKIDSLVEELQRMSEGW